MMGVLEEERSADASLLSRSALGDRGAMHELLVRHSGAVHAAIFSRLGANPDLEDLAQEAMRRAVAGLGTLRDAAKVGPWLYGIALRVASEWLRRRPRRSLSLDDPRAAAAEPPAAGEGGTARLDSMREALDLLEETDREALVLHYLEGMDYEAMAARLDLSRAGVAKRLSKARVRLREILEEEARG